MLKNKYKSIDARTKVATAFMLGAVTITATMVGSSNTVNALLGPAYVSVGDVYCFANNEWCNSDALPGFTLDSSSDKITLENYDGSHIKTNLINSVTIYLKGENKITIDGNNYGLFFDQYYATGDNYRSNITATITGDEGASLTIVGEGPNYYGMNRSDILNSLRGIAAYGPIIVDDKINLNIDLLESQDDGEDYNYDSYGILTTGEVTFKSPFTKIKMGSNVSGDTTTAYGVKASNIVMGDDANVEIDISDSAGKIIPLKTNKVELGVSQTIVGLVGGNVTLAAREVSGKDFDRWDIEGIADVDTSIVTTQFSMPTSATVQAKPLYKDIVMEEYQILGYGVEGEFKIGDSQTVRGYIFEGEIKKGSRYVVEIDADNTTLLYVDIDGKRLAADQYSVESGSTIVLFDNGLLDSLGVGDHSVGFGFARGYAGMVFEIREDEQPGQTDPSDDNDPSQEDGDSTGAEGGSSNIGEIPMSPDAGRSQGVHSGDSAVSVRIILAALVAFSTMVVTFLKVKPTIDSKRNR